MPSNPFANVSVPPQPSPAVKHRYSLTVDVVGFRRCARQYGTFHVHKYAPAYQTQLYFGTILHQVLDRCHAHYQGVPDPSTKLSIPDDGNILSDEEIQDFFDEVRGARRDRAPEALAPSDIVGYFLEVEDGLKSQGIWAVSPDLRIKAVRILQYFNALEGPELYPRVVDTEHRLQADRGDHILHGVVDLLANASSGSSDLAEREMWDYKGTSRVGLTPSDLETYEFQMRVYAKLYELKHGVLPGKAMLYFVNELDGPTPPPRRPVNAVMEISLAPDDIEEATREFADTVSMIEYARSIDRWDPAQPGTISEQDCAICDLRWDCPTPNGGKGVALRYP